MSFINSVSIFPSCYLGEAVHHEENSSEDPDLNPDFTTQWVDNGEISIIFLWDFSYLKVRIIMSKVVVRIKWKNAYENHFLKTKVLYSFVFIEITYY